MFVRFSKVFEISVLNDIVKEGLIVIGILNKFN